MQVQQPPEQHCFDQHCGLCTFELGDDEPIIATNVLGTRFARLTKPRSEYCDWNCNHPHNIAAAFHESCLAYAGPFFLHIKELGRMVRHSLIPELGASLAKPALMEEFAARYVMERTPFPLEVCQRIAPYLVRPCSVAATLSVRRGKPRKMTVSLLGEIWVQFVKVHGTPYVAFVANTPAPASGFAGTAVLVYRPWQHDCVVRIMHDPWGVRRIVFMCGNSKLSVSERKNIWWESLRLPTTSESQELTMFSDEVKLRRVFVGKEPSAAILRPVVPALGGRKTILFGSNGLRSAVQLTLMRFNETTTIGYNAELKDGVLVRLSATHVEVNGVPLPTSHRFVGEAKKKTQTVTAQLHLLEGVRGIICMAEPPQADYVASAGLIPRLPQPASSYPRGKRGEAFYLSVIELRPATSMRLSMDGRRITGLLLVYQDGAEDTLGRVCLAKLQPPERLYEDGIWILAEQVDKYPQVVRVVVEKPGRNADRYLHVRWQGQLEWWSSARQCELHYLQGQTLPARP